MSSGDEQRLLPFTFYPWLFRFPFAFTAGPSSAASQHAGQQFHHGKELFIFEQPIMMEAPLTLREIGEQFRISRERVRQLENRVLKKFNDRFKLDFRKLDL